MSDTVLAKGDEAVVSLGIKLIDVVCITKHCLVSVSSDDSGASKAAIRHTPMDLVSLATQIQEVQQVTCYIINHTLHLGGQICPCHCY